MSDETATAQAPGTRTRARERPGRCRAPKLDTGLPCRRDAGAGTDHHGDGPCSDHDDGTWTRLEFADDVPAQEAFIAAVAADLSAGTRALIEPLGYHRRDVVALEAADEDFKLRVEEARGWDPESLRREWRRRAIECESDRLLELAVKTKLPEGETLRHTRHDGQIDVRAVPYVNLGSMAVDRISPAVQQVLDTARSDMDVLIGLQRLIEAKPEEIPAGGRPALELLEQTG